MFSLTFVFLLPRKVVQSAHRAKEIMNNSHRIMNDEEARRIATVEAFRVAERKTQELNTKLAEAKREQKSTETTLDGVEKQAET